MVSMINEEERRKGLQRQALCVSRHESKMSPLGLGPVKFFLTKGPVEMTNIKSNCPVVTKFRKVSEPS